jgi:acetyltransferase-like isoleucine patch superfamily enzyme
MLRGLDADGNRALRYRHFGARGFDQRFDPLGSDEPAGQMRTGSHLPIERGARVSALQGCFVGDGVTVGLDLCAVGGDHDIAVVVNSQWGIRTGDTKLRLVIELAVWSGARATPLKGVTIGKGGVVGAGSATVHDAPPYVVASANPCVVKRPDS